MCVLYILCHYYVTIIRIIYPIIFPIMSQRCIISLYYVTIMSLLLLLFVLLFAGNNPPLELDAPIQTTASPFPILDVPVFHRQSFGNMTL